MLVINLCPHDVTVMGWDYERLYPASGVVARCESNTETIGEVDGVPVTRTVMGSVNGLPEPTEGIVYIVSYAVARTVPDRDDVYFPSGALRDGNGRICACKTLGHV